MKSMGSPPAGVVLTSRVVLIMFGEKVSLSDPDDKVWKKAVLSMNNPEQFIQKVKNYNGETIEQNILDTVNKIINDPSKKFTEKDMAGQSFAASKLCAWAVNIVIFNKIFKQVKPLVE
jgi:dynein heavy chain, axonemal